MTWAQIAAREGCTEEEASRAAYSGYRKLRRMFPASLLLFRELAAQMEAEREAQKERRKN